MPPEQMPGPMPGMMPWMIIGAVLVLLILLLVAAVLVVGLVHLVRALRGRGSARLADGQSSEQGALRILDERYARGDVDQDDYEQRRRILRS